jgi:ElaB/YqjD/DUF883 family membrane-anchored ribosome-binding protein
LDGIFQIGVTVAEKSIIEQTNESVDDALEQAKERLGTLPAKLGKQLDDLNLNITSLAARAAGSAGDIWKATRKQVRKNPGTALSLGALLGFAIGFLGRRRD